MHIKPNLILLLFLLLLFGCTNLVNKKCESPEDLIHRDTMVDVIVDIRLFEASLVFDQKKGVKKFNDRKYFLHNSVMEKHSITREQFENSFTYYQNDLKVLDGIFADAITKLSKLKSQVELEQ